MIKKTLDKRAFTILELMVVIVLVSVIAGFAIPSYVKSVRKARMRDALVQLNGLRAAGITYFAQALKIWDAGGPVTTVESDISVINSNLGTSVIPNDMTYDYIHLETDTRFALQATWVDPTGANSFTIIMLQDPISTTSTPPNPCCTPNGNCTFGTQVVVPDCS